MTQAPSSRREDPESSKSLETLAKEQGIQPLKDPSKLFGKWPGEVDDGFEEMIRDLRGQDSQDRSPIFR